MTDARETGEFLSAYVNINVVFQWRIMTLVLMMILLPLLFLPLVQRRIDKALCYIDSVRHRLINVTILVLLLFLILIEIVPTWNYICLFGQKANMQVIEGVLMNGDASVVSTPMRRFIFSYHAVKRSERDFNNVKNDTYTAKVDTCTYQSPHIVLVIGESYNKHHSALYGYSLPTTPLQKKRQENGELFVFEDVVTCWNITSNAFIDIFSNPMFPRLFRLAGYNVTFFSNQFVQKIFLGKTSNKSGSFFLSDKEFCDSLFNYRNYKKNNYDLDLVGQLVQYRNDNDKRFTLDIIHLIGQHFEYDKRYPKSAAVFSEDDYINRKIETNEKKVVMDYDNATLYNDMVLDSILNVYDNEEAVVIFVSDHGEEVFDDIHISGRLFHKPTSSQARYEFEVPMWMWCSDSYRQLHPEIVTRIKESVKNPLLTDDISQTLLYLAGISSQYTDESRNVLSTKYQPKTRIIAGTVDYDKIINQAKD